MQAKMHVVGMPPSSYRPSPPSARPPSSERAALTEVSPPPVQEPEPVAAKKKKKLQRSPESIRKQKATIARKRAAQARAGQTLVSQPETSKPAKKNGVAIQLTGVQAWLRAELDAMAPEIRRMVREELRRMLAGA